MTAPPSVDAYDAQMLDFSSDPDVPMNITGSADFFAEALMDHDGHLVASTYAEHPSVEVDMEEYVGDNAEYEMADETAEFQRPHGDELLDIEVYDASLATSPLVSPQPLQPSTDVSIDSERQPTTSTYSEHAAHPELQGEPKSEVNTAPLDRPAADASRVEPSTSDESASLEPAASEQLHPADAPDDGHPLTSESHEQLGDLTRTDGQPHEEPAPAGAGDEGELPRITEAHAADQHQNVEPPNAESAPPPGGADASGATVQDGKATDQTSMAVQETIDSLHVSDGVYIDPPPAVLLSVADDAEPGFALFNLPDVGGESTEEASGNQKVYSLLLEDRPTLYYESLSSVFEALRLDDALLSRVPHSFEGELVLDAYDLQLAVSEDNVHSREISLHDLNILHDGSDFVGPLRLHLRAAVPRFIIRYYALQEQIQRLQVAAETEGEHHEEHHEHYDTVEEQPLPQQEEAPEPLLLPATVSEGLEVPPITEAEEPVKEPSGAPEPAEGTPEEGYEPQGASATQEPVAEYYEVTGETIHGLADENRYEDTSVGDEDKSTRFDALNADQVHDVATEDTGAPATITGQESEFGDEQTEYLDYAQPEEYDERYGEELPERVGAASSAQYGEPQHYGEGEQGTSTAVDETQTVLPDLDEEDHSAATPIPPHATFEPESSEPTTTNFSNKPVSLDQETLSSSNEELAASESKDEIDHVQAPSNQEQEQSTMQARVFSEIEESDSNFVKMLEREADAEFDRTFDAQQSGQESSIEATLQLVETWDEWDDEDAEGDDEEDWIDPDAESNESSITLSSKASSKRNYDEVDPSEEPSVENPQNSPELKRPRVE